MALRKASSFTFVQEEPSAIWTIDHNLDRTPAVDVSIDYFDTLQVVLPLEVEITSPNQVVVRFSSAQSGTARLV